MSNETQLTDAVAVAEKTFVHDLMDHCIDEFIAMPEVWQKLSKDQQDEVIGRLEKCVKHTTGQAIATIASFGLTRVKVGVGNILIKDLVLEGKITVARSGDQMQHDFCDMQGTDAYLVVSHAVELTKQPHGHQGEADQRDLELGDPGEGEPIDSGDAPEPPDDDEAKQDPETEETLADLPVDQAHCERVVAELTAKSALGQAQARELVAAAAMGDQGAILELKQNIVDDEEALMAPFYDVAGIDQTLDLGQLE